MRRVRHVVAACSPRGRRPRGGRVFAARRRRARPSHRRRDRRQGGLRLVPSVTTEQVSSAQKVPQGGDREGTLQRRQRQVGEGARGDAGAVRRGGQRDREARRRGMGRAAVA